MPQVSREYFAREPVATAGSKLWGRYERCLADPFDPRPLYANAHMHLYGDGSDQGVTYGVSRMGAQGEIAAVRVNRARALALARTALIAAPEVTWRAAALKSDSGATKATTLGQQILENFWKTRGLKAQWRELIFQAVGYSCAYKFPEWDRGAGDMVPGPAGDGSDDTFEGDVVTHNVSPWRVHFDPTFTSWDDVPWAYVRLRKTRWDLAEMAAAAAARGEVFISGLQADPDTARDAVLIAPQDPYIASLQRDQNDADSCTVVHFLHKPRPSLKFGRHVGLLSGNVVLFDRPLVGPAGDYEAWPLVRLQEGSYVDTPWAWTSFWDALGSQEIQDAIVTTLSTIITTLGTPVIAKEQGSEWDASTLVMGGVREMQYAKNGKPPQGVNLAVFPKEGLEFLEKMEGGQQALMQLNDVSLGRPQTAQMNAQAFAVLASMAVQQAAPMQQSAVEALGMEGRIILGLYAKHAKGERMLSLIGKQNASLLNARQWQGAELLPVKDVAVEIGNPNEQTAPGRIMKLQTLAQIGVPLTLEQAQQVLDVGRVEMAERATRNELILIAEENEMLQSGEMPKVDASENHPLHFREHFAELRNNDIKADDARANIVREHAAMHYIQQFGDATGGQAPGAMDAMMADPMLQPRLRFMLGLSPLDPSLVSVPPPGPPPGPPNGTQPPAPGDGAQTQPPKPGEPSGTPKPPPGGPPDVAAQVGNVEPPVNPVDGQKFSNATPPAQGAMPQ
jgi:hypothetical protein